MKTLPPGSTIGILGGGQLGRMTAMAAAQLGYHTHIFCPDEDAPALEVASAHSFAAYDDVVALEQFARAVDVVTLEWENVPVGALDTLAPYVAVHPSAAVLRVAQDREQEKTFAQKSGLGTADFAIVRSAVELAAVMNAPPQSRLRGAGEANVPQRCRGNFILKSTRFGYDGKGQAVITPDTKPAEAWNAVNAPVGILESFVDFTCEVSVIVARRADGATTVYPPSQNIHRNGILAETHAPAALDSAITHEAEHAARHLAEALNVVGLLAVEMFVLRHPTHNGQHILINEMAPRPHNSGHWTMDAGCCSQFEQLVRAVCGLPLGSTAPTHHAVMRNLIGHDADNWQHWLQNPDARLHLYGKKEARDGRKMGHVTVLGSPL